MHGARDSLLILQTGYGLLFAGDILQRAEIVDKRLLNGIGRIKFRTADGCTITFGLKRLLLIGAKVVESIKENLRDLNGPGIGSHGRRVGSLTH